MTRWCTFLFIATLCLESHSTLAQNEVLECFGRDIDAATKISACGAAIDGSDLPDETRALAFVSRGAARAQNGDTSGALADYDEALKLMPGDFSAQITRAQLLEKLGRVEDAKADYSTVIAKAPHAEDVLLGEAYARRGALRLHTDDALGGIADLGEARRFDPRNPMPFKMRGAYFLENGDVEQAAAELDQAVALNAGDVSAQLMLGAAQLHLGQFEAAVRAFNSALIVDPGNAEALRGRATGYGQGQNYAASIADYTAALNIDGEDIEALEGRGVALLRVGVFADAIADFDKLLALTPENINATFFRANARLQNGDPEGAGADFSTILARQPVNIDALLGRGIARQFAGDYNGAEVDFTAALKSDPTAAQPLANRGYVRFMAGDFKGSVEDLTAAMALPNAPKHLALWKFIAEARAGNAKTDTLTFAMRNLQPTQWPAPIMRYFLGEAGGNEIVSAAIEDPQHSNGRLCETYFFLGQAALIIGDAGEAERLFKAAIETNAVRFTEYAGAKAELAHITNSGE